MPGVLIRENVESHLTMRQNRNKRCKHQTTPDLVTQKVCVNTHVDTIDVNNPAGINSIYKLIGQSFRVRLRARFPPLKLQTDKHLESGDAINVADIRGITNKKDSLLLLHDYSASTLHRRLIILNFK